MYIYIYVYIYIRLYVYSTRFASGRVTETVKSRGVLRVVWEWRNTRGEAHRRRGAGEAWQTMSCFRFEEYLGRIMAEPHNYIYLHIYTCIYINTHIHIYIYIYTHNIYIYYLPIYLSIHLSLSIYLSIYLSIPIYIYVYIYSYVHISLAEERELNCITSGAEAWFGWRGSRERRARTRMWPHL